MRQPSPKSSLDASTSQSSSQQSNSSSTDITNDKSIAFSTITPSSSNNSMLGNTTITPAEKAASQDAEDFFARAKAMGLNLTRQDYERARAGVSAFLKAQRVEKNDASPNLGESSSTVGASNNNVVGFSDLHVANVEGGGPGSAKIPSQSKLANRSTSSPMLSFFTAVVPTEEDDAKARPSLDDVGALEERKRRKERRKRIKERRERDGDKTPIHVKELSLTSTLLDGSPLTAQSIGISGDDVSSSLPTSGRQEIGTWPGRVGLGLQMEDCLMTGEDEDNVDQMQNLKEVGKEKYSGLYSPAQLSRQIQLACQSPGLLKMSQKAHIDVDGRLTLMATPNRRQTTEDMAAEEDVVAMTNAGADTDDSGVFLVCDPVKKDWIRQQSQSSNDASPLMDLHESLDKMGLLDQVMAQNRSPVRLRREAKAREREVKKGKNSRQSDLVVMTATSNAPVVVAQSALQPLSRSRDNNIDIHQSKNVRWANNSSSPRQRMTTKEHYDFAFYGIAPNPADMTGAIPTFYDEEIKRNGAETGEEEQQSFHIRQRTTSNWMRSHLGQSNMGSPIAIRGSTMTSNHDSPVGLTLGGFESMSDRNDASNMSAKRGLLFGPSSSTDRTFPAFTGGDQMDAAHLFSHGPTLARSPARNVFDSFTMSTPTSMTRSVTALAAPISFRQGGVEESPDRVMLMRAHSSGTLDRKLPGHLRQTSLLAKEMGKENVSPEISGQGKKAPTGWALRSPMDRSETISPAAIFGMSSSQQRIRVLSGEIQEMGRLPLEPTKGRLSHSDEDGDDEREFDGSPAINSSGAGRRYQRSPFQKSSTFAKNHTRDSSASTSVFEGSPMYLDIHNRTASIVSSLPSSSILANALGMKGEEKGSNSSQKDLTQSTKTKKKKKNQGDQQQLGPSQMDVRQNDQDQELSSSNSMSTYGRTEWDKSDGTRVIKLISEELQAALESGTLPDEPPARYYKLPPDWGQSKSKPLSVSYAGMIGQALLSSSDGRLSLNEIYNWISTVFPFFERGDRGWQNSIRHNLSLNKSFIKVEREAHIPGKGGWWAIKQGHEERFRGGSYIAPGSALSQKVGPKTPKTSLFKLSKDEEQDQWTPLQQENSGEVEAQMLRRKRQESDGRSEAASDSDYQPAGQVVKSIKKSKKVKLVGGVSKKARSSLAASSPVVEGKHSNLAPIQKRVPLRPIQSSSPQDASFDSMTPHRSHQFIASSGHGSTSTTSMMAGMPMLTDASSPPSSPNNTFDGLMPPPSGGIQGAASSQSARKRKQAVNRAVDLMNSGLIQQHSTYAPPQSASLSSTNYNHLSAHTLQASPLAHMRGNNANNGNGSALVNNNARLRAGPGHSLITAMDSPLRRHSTATSHGSPIDNNSPTRLFVNSPISSMRGHHDSSLSMERSTTGVDYEGEKENQIPSTQRGSPVRVANQFANLQHQNNFQSPAGMHLQMAVGPAGQSTQNGANSQFTTFGGNTPTRYTDQNNGNFLYQRWGLSPSPVKSLRFSAGIPNMYSHNGTLVSQGNGSSSNELDDPFDYSGNLQHELEMTTNLGQFDGISESPIKMAYPQIVRNQFFNGQVPQQQSLQQQQVQYVSNGSYSTSLAASQVFGGGPTATIYRDANEN